MKPSGSEFFFVESFLDFVVAVVTNLISLFIVGLINFLFLLEAASATCVFQKICPFHLNDLLCLHSVIHSILFYPLNFCKVGDFPLLFLISLTQAFFPCFLDNLSKCILLL